MSDLRVTREGAFTFLEWSGGRVRCAVGRGGIAHKKTEGDGITPIGTWPLRHVLYRPDHVPPPTTGLPVAAIASDDGWCDAPNDANYNRLVKLPYRAGHERLWRDDALYDVVVVIGFNDDPVVKGVGSAIFLHIARENYEPTEGCVALSRDDVLRILAVLRPGDTITI